MHKTTTRFWDCFNKMPKSIQVLAKKKFILLKEDPRHPSLHFKKVGRFWSVRISINYRCLAIEDENNFIWVWIGTHEEYNKLIQ
jgi:hypothetical protein